MHTEYVYAKPPMIEVIAEVRWRLTSLAAIPGAQLDPYFPATRVAMTKLAADRGYGSIETLIPDSVPLELLGYQVVSRYRTAPGTWPLFQIGPGVFSCNAVPPYQGWREFRGHLMSALEVLFAAFPSSDKLFQYESASLRYLNAFTDEFGGTEALTFLRDGLGTEVTIKAPEFAGIIPATPHRVALDLEYGLATKGDVLQLKAFPGQKDGREATLVELGTVGRDIQCEASADSLLEWFDSAHIVLSNVFEALTSDVVKNVMGPKSEVQ